MNTEPDDQASLDRELVARAKRDRDAFALLYDRYVDRVYRYCFGRLDSREAAEDATSIVFAKALHALPNCRNDTFRSWLFAIAHNVVTDRFRTARPSLSLDEAAETPDPTPMPEELVSRQDENQVIRALIAQLPPNQRDVVELRLAGLTGSEIAHALNRSHGAIRVAQYRAYARLRTLVEQADPLEDWSHGR